MKNTIATTPNTTSPTGKKKFKKLLYLGDLHWSSLVKSFLNSEKFDENYGVVIVGDIFDRWDHSAEIYETVRMLYEQGRLTMVLWNHCLFALLGIGLRKESNSQFAKKARSILSSDDLDILCWIFSDQLYTNSGEATIKSFERAYGDCLAEKMDEIIDFLALFSLYAIDPANNLVAHWTAILSLVDWSLVWETIGGRFVSWFDYVRELDIGFRNLDRNTLFRLTARERELGDRIFADMERNWAIRDPKLVKGNWNYAVDMVPTWFCNRIFTDPRYGEAHKALRSELDRHSFGRQVCGHWFNDSKTFGNPDDPEMAKYGDTILRLDRASWGFGNFGYAVVDIASNAIEEVWDVVDFMRNRR